MEPTRVLPLITEENITEVSELPARDSAKTRGSHLSGNFIFAILLVSFVSAFPLGHNITGMNSAQDLVVGWLRQVKCQRIGGHPDQNVSKAFVDLSPHDREIEIWCKHVPPEDRERMRDLNPDLNKMWAVTSSIGLLGATVGCLFANTFVQYTGIKWSIMLSSLIFAFGSILGSCAKIAASPEMLVAGRFVLGFGPGVLGVVVPIYITEVSPASVRGAAGIVSSITYRLGSIFGSSLAFPFVFGTDSAWPIIIVMLLVPTVIACVALPFCPESPRQLYISRSNPTAAEKSLQWFRNKSDVREDMEELRKEKESFRGTIGCFGFLQDAKLRRVFLYCAFPAMAEAFCGSFALLFYSTSIFRNLRLDQPSSTAASIGLWCSALLATLASALLVEKLGRRLLLAVSYLGTLATLVFFVVCLTLAQRGDGKANYGSLVCLAANMFFFSLGAQSVPKILPGELFAKEARSAASLLTNVVTSASGLITTLLFPLIIGVAKQYTYLIFAGYTLFLTVFVLLKLPETRGRELNDIQMELKKLK